MVFTVNCLVSCLEGNVAYFTIVTKALMWMFVSDIVLTAWLSCLVATKVSAYRVDVRKASCIHVST